MTSTFRRTAARFILRDGALYVLWAALCTLLSARSFYGYMLKQTGGEWSAPLDDVFIHFDYARATAAGHPFEWIAGNGYSSGNTSLLYPFVLAIGYGAGFTGPRIMVWAAMVAMVSVFGTLLVARRVLVFPDRRADGWARATSYLLPLILLGVGALDWSLWSGMEVAIFLGAWACATLTYLALVRDDGTHPTARGRAGLGWKLGAWGAVMTLIRPEATTTIAVFGLAAAWHLSRMHGRPAAAGTLARTGTPALAVTIAQAIANRALTGEWAASGAIVKLAVYNPFFSSGEKVADYLFNLKYEILRNTEYHFTDKAAYGFLMPALALAAIAVPRSRHMALVLWGQIAGWILIVALNGQVRWQNERYTMPAVAWLLLAAGLGASALLRKVGRPNVLFVVAVGALAAQAVGIATRPPNTNPELRVAWSLALAAGAGAAVLLAFWPTRIALVVSSLFLAHLHQAPNLRGQRWFFGRASRNIRDQHVVAGRWLREMKAERVLVGDAGALVYASERPGLDIIGLGGFEHLPFARASTHGLPATLELLEHVAPEARPDVLAIYPSWWGVLPTWFATEVLARFPVQGNVICGGYEDVVYRADWHLLGSGTLIRNLPDGEMVRDSVDVADLLSEREHAYRMPSPGGWTDMKILADPAQPIADLFDGGRKFSPGEAERFTLRGVDPLRPFHLVVRTAPSANTRVLVMLDGERAGAFDLAPSDSWSEPEVRIAPARTSTLKVELRNEGPGEFVDYHVWVTQ